MEINFKVVFDIFGKKNKWILFKGIIIKAFDIIYDLLLLYEYI